MKKFALTIFLSCLFLLPASASAEVEEWYTYWAIGPAGHNYPGDADAFIDFIDSLPGIDRTETAYDMLGFYWPYDNNTMLGFVISGSSDRLEDSFGDHVQFNHYLYGFSAMHFFGREIGDGFYVRGDAGIAKVNLSSNFANTVEVGDGLGFLFGFGYSWAISEQSRILVGMSLSNKNIDGDGFSSTALTIGGLW